MKKVMQLLLVFFFVCSPFSVSAESSNYEADYKVLVLNSYHEGYEWSDDILEGIKIQFAKELFDTSITVEYLDTKVNYDENYREMVYKFLVNKYSGKNYDVIIASDDNAFAFMQEYGEEVFPGIPYVFCGVNYFDDSIIQDNFTGVVETYSLDDTLAVALEVNPKLKHIYVFNDDSRTGKAVQKNIDETISRLSYQLSFHTLRDKTKDEQLKIISSLSDDSAIVFGAYFIDSLGNPIDHNETLKEFSDTSAVPIYGLWEFALGNGITGGSLASGYFQGETAGEYAIRILKGEEPNSIPINHNVKNSYKFDYNLLLNYDIPIEKLPSSSTVINRRYHDKERVLVLHSYHSQMKWVKGIEEGIESHLNQEDYHLYYDYMDTKRVADPSYIKQVYDQMIVKHSNEAYDLILVSDNTAFNFILKFGKRIFGDIPVVFCGINNIEQYEGLMNQNTTGVVEEIDVKATIDLALMQNPTTDRIYVINDHTPTGEANQLTMKRVEQHFSAIDFQYLRDFNMSDLLTYLSKIEENSIVMLLSYTRDKSNSIFSYEDSGSMISSAAVRPVYVIWDFYIGTGVVGGKLTSGFNQGSTAASMIVEILDGTPASQIAINVESPNQYILDYEVMKAFGMQNAFIPEGANLVNVNKSFLEEYFWPIVIIVSILSFALYMVLDSRKRVIDTQSKADEIEKMAAVDELTGVYTRRKGFVLSLNALSKMENKPLTLCFIDLDNLKKVNDKYGHDEGDFLIKACVNSIKMHIRDDDVFFRYGGDEFVILFLNTTLENVSHKMKHIQGYLSEVNDSRESGISFSYGLASYDQEMSLEDLIRKADKNMYVHKQDKKAK
jgi:diguanylate cyclase (GGDEF)-like protein